MTLTPVQVQALAQLRELTNGADDEEVTIGVLSSVGWDVQKAAELIFESHPVADPAGPGPSSSSSSYPASSPSPSGSSSSSRSDIGVRGWGRQPLEVDDSLQGITGRGGGQFPRRTLLLTLLAFPLHILSGMLRFLFTLLKRIVPVRGVPSFLGFGLGRPPSLRGGRSSLAWVGLGLGGLWNGGTGSGTSGRGIGWGNGNGTGGMGGPERWIRELEEETGGVCLRRRRGVSASGVGLNERDGSKYLPEFEECTYEEMLKKCQREMKVGCVVLVSEEHDDVKEFKKGTLMDAGFVGVLSENEVVVWGGDVRDREAWSASEKLQATTYPFVAFIALQPRRNPSSSSSSSASAPTLTVLSRHQGPSTASGPTSASTLKAHVEGSVLPRVMPYLRDLLQKQRERDRDRELRAEQDRAFEEAKRRDKERIESRMKEERKREEERVREEREREAQRKVRETRATVRRWTRNWLKEQQKRKGVRIGIRLPTGTRLIETVETLTGLYALVDAQFVEEEEADGPLVVDGIEGGDEDALDRYVQAQGDEGYWGFKISTAYPRKEVVWRPGVRLEDLPELKGGAQVVVERHAAADVHSDSD